MNLLHYRTLAELHVDDVRFVLSNLPDLESPPKLDATHAATIDCIGEEDQDETRRRRHVEREWPELGTMLNAEYFGQTYTAQIIPARKKLKSNKQIVLLDGPAQGAVCDSFSEAMLQATEEQRGTRSLGRKGVSNGWVFWQWPGKPAEYDEAKPDPDA